jgi:hypothetical protein
VVLDELHGPTLGRAGHRHCPEVAQERVERIAARGEPTLDVVDGVDESAVDLDLATTDDAHGAGKADPGLVVAVDVGAHGELGLLLGRGQQLPDLLGVGERVVASGDRPGDRAGLHSVAFDPHVHLR